MMQFFADWEKLIQSTEFTLGSYVENFEKLFAEFIEVNMSLGQILVLDALILALKAIGVGRRDEVISVPVTLRYNWRNCSCRCKTSFC